MDDFKVILLFVGLVLLLLGIRYVVSKAVHSGADAVENAVKRKMNERSTNESQNLADRFNSEDQK